ncbi:hypothetical protein Btru_062213 [Bulinus truncatus]|nr:hypothetical protein Btru_062213 [Bulinus truncatus]
MALTQTDKSQEKNDDDDGDSDWNENQRLRSTVMADASSKAPGRKRLESEHPLMFVRRNQFDDEKKAIFVRINNIAFSASANNETVRAIKRHVSSTDILSRTSSVPSTPRASKPPRRQPRSPPTKTYLNILQRHRKTSFATMVDHYAQMDESYEREHTKKNTSLEDEVRQIDAFFNSLATKPDKSLTKAPDHEEDKIAQLWKDLGFSVVKSKNRPSLFEITSTDASPVKPAKQLAEIRKSKIYKSPVDKEEPSIHPLSTDPRATNSLSDTYMKDDLKVPGSPKMKRRSEHSSKTTISWSTVEDEKLASPKIDSNKSPTKFRKYSEKFKGLFSKRKPAATDKASTSSRDDLNNYENNKQTQKLEISKSSVGFGSSSEESQQELSRHVKWSDSKQVAFDKDSSNQKEISKTSNSKNERSYACSYQVELNLNVLRL